MVHIKLVTEQNESLTLDFADLDESTDFMDRLSLALNLRDVEFEVDCERHNFSESQQYAYLWN